MSENRPDQAIQALLGLETSPGRMSVELSPGGGGVPHLEGKIETEAKP